MRKPRKYCEEPGCQESSVVERTNPGIWCAKHNAERIARIDRGFKEIEAMFQRRAAEAEEPNPEEVPR